MVGQLSKTFKMSLIQARVSANKHANLDRAVALIRKCRDEQGADVCVLPECFNSAYDVHQFRSNAEPTTPGGVTYERLRQAAIDNKVLLIGGSIPEICSDGSDRIYNTCMVFGPDGALLAKHRKMHLFDIDIPGKISFQESLVLSAGNDVTVFDTAYGRMGVGICYDLRFPEYSSVAAQQLGAKYLIYPGAFNMTTGPLHWRLLLQSTALNNAVYVAGCSPARPLSGEGEAGYIAYGHTLCCDPWGAVLTEAEGEDCILTVEIDPSKIDTMREGIPALKQKRTDRYTTPSLL